ncbi:FtsX-like permease family protein [Streptomyces sp. NPDC054933]
MRAVLRWELADLRAHRGQAALMVLVTAVITVSLILANALLQNAGNPWQRIFGQSQGAHLWLHVRPGVDTSPLARLDGVAAVAGPYRTAPSTLVRSAEKVPLELRAVGPGLPTVSRPLVRSGRWLDPSVSNGVVLEGSFARSVWAAAGDTVTVRGLDGATHTMRVLGVADTADQGAYPNWTPGLGWVLPGTLDRIEPDPSHTAQAVGLRLRDPATTDFTAQQAVTALGSDQVTMVSTWQQVRSSMDLDNRLLGLLLAVFGLVALLAAALAVAGAAGSRVLAQVQDIAMLKAVGFTPAQIIRMFLYEHTALAVVGIVLGTAAASGFGPLLPSPLGDAVTFWQAQPDHLGALVATGAGAVLTIALATVLPAWRAGRVPAVPAVRADRPVRRMSLLARLALLLRLPPALVLGARDAFYRPLRAGLTIARLAIPMLMITVALGSWATLDGFRDHPERVGLAATLTAKPSGIDAAAASRLLSRQPGVAAAYPGVELQALVPGQTTTITVRALGTSARPYPFALAEGRGIQDTDEAVAGQGALDQMHVQVGQWVRVMTGGTPRILHIVGRSIEPDHNGEMLSVGMEALEGPVGLPQPQYYALVLRPGASPSAVRTGLLAASHNQLDVQLVTNPADQLGAVRGVVIGLVVVLALIGLAELVTATGSGLRDHTRDLAVLRAMGLTPRQVTAVIVTSTSLLTTVAVLAGTAVGVLVSDRLINLQGHASGVGAGIAQMPAPGTLLLAGTLAVVVAACVSVVPAARATRARVTMALSQF